MKTAIVENPEWKDAPYEDVYFWSNKLPKWKKQYYKNAIKTKRFKDPEGKIEVPQFIIKETP